jgi:cell fate regulator YaaT (PSP1 superfamily)
VTYIDFVSEGSIKLPNENIPYLLSVYPCKAIFRGILQKNLAEKHNNISSCLLSGGIEKKYSIDPRNIIEISCNGLLPSTFVEIPDQIIEQVYPEDFIIVQHEDVFDVAQVKMVGEFVKLRRCNIGQFHENLPQFVRKASNDDLERIRKNLEDEQRAISIFKTNIKKYLLEMKLVCIHYQFDRKKLFFFYTADGRVDFRELAKGLASEFKTRIELRQIGVRDEAKKIGGVGSCGREFCCLSFLNNFKKISTQLANDQNMFSSMGKLSGPCGKLKCCLSFEVE